MVPYLKAENANNRHILMQPENEASYMLADDLSLEIVNRHHKTYSGVWKPGRMVVETSPDNYQVWIHSSRPLSNHEKQYWLKKMHSDPGATPKNRWGRMPGFRNRKEKYQSCSNYYPLSKLIWVDWANSAVIPSINQVVSSEKDNSKNFATKKYLSELICRTDYDKGNQSITDFSYALALARRGFDETYIKNRILQERVIWDNHLGEKRFADYLNRTVTKAMKIITSS